MAGEKITHPRPGGRIIVQCSDRPLVTFTAPKSKEEAVARLEEIEKLLDYSDWSNAGVVEWGLECELEYIEENCL